MTARTVLLLLWLAIVGRALGQSDLNSREVRLDEGVSFTIPSIWSVLAERHGTAARVTAHAPAIVFHGVGPHLHPESSARAETSTVTLVVSRWPTDDVHLALSGKEGQALLARTLTLEGFTIAQSGFSDADEDGVRMVSSHFTGNYAGEASILVQTVVWESPAGTVAVQLRCPQEVTELMRQEVTKIMQSVRFQGKPCAVFHDPEGLKVKTVAAAPGVVPAASPTFATTLALPAASRPPLDLAEALHQDSGSLALVEGPTGAGSGFVCNLDGKKWLVTNVHILAAGPRLNVTMLDRGPLQVGAGAVAVSHDIARLAVASPTTPALELLDNLNVNAAVGDEVCVLGNAEGAHVVTPIVGKLVGIGPNLVEVDAPFVPGNSGSPIIHRRTGKVLGVATYILQRAADGAPGLSLPATVRRFGYRLDSIRAWQTIEWPKFNAEADALRQAGEATLDLESILQSIAKTGDLRTAAGQQKSLALRRAVQSYLDATKVGNRASDADVQAARTSFLDTARRFCADDLPRLRETLTYDYFQRRADEEQVVRYELGRLFDKIRDAPVASDSRAPRQPGR